MQQIRLAYESTTYTNHTQIYKPRTTAMQQKAELLHYFLILRFEFQQLCNLGPNITLWYTFIYLFHYLTEVISWFLLADF